MNERWEITMVGGDVTAKLFRNDFQVYSFTMGSMIEMCAALWVKQNALRVHPVPIYNRQHVHNDVIGRAVFYREFPAIIADFDGEKGRVMLRSDFPLPRINTGFPSEPWDGDEEPKCSQDIWEDLLSPKIHWHREESV